MGWFDKKKDIIKVEFYEYNNNTPFATSEVPIQQLPDSFEVETNLTIKEENWSVVQSIPQTKAEFSKTGNLKIFLSKIQLVDPNKILFSLPTINDRLFETEESANNQLFLIHEDDWRQFEFICPSFVSEINTELSSVVEIYEKYQVNNIGFKKLHIRNLIEEPLKDSKITVDGLSQNFEIIKQFDGFGANNDKLKAKNSFAFELSDGLVFFGQTENNYISFLCVSPHSDYEKVAKIIATKYQLLFVNWCRAEVIS